MLLLASHTCPINRPCRRCLSEAERSAYHSFVHIADLSAWGAHRRAIGRYIGGAPINCAPTGYYRSWLVKIIIGPLRWPEYSVPFCGGKTYAYQPITALLAHLCMLCSARAGCCLWPRCPAISSAYPR